ncbi:TPA: hypothetical protein ACU3FO_004519 [Salmonella enterica]|nr:hypothetical protein [Salmonella enterica]ELO7938190.1 hypothetical protein [Salmonella enterica]HAK8439469.1 hypothetical protein [Salmonella enterica]
MTEFDYARLLCAMALITDEQMDEPGFDIDTLCIDKLGVTFEDFQRVGNALLPLTIPSKSPITSTWYHAFMVDGIAYVKQEAEV